VRPAASRHRIIVKLFFKHFSMRSIGHRLISSDMAIKGLMISGSGRKRGTLLITDAVIDHSHNHHASATEFQR
jgi:hypothetical protein